MRVFSIRKDQGRERERERDEDSEPGSLCPVSALIRIRKSHVQMAAMAARLSLRPLYSFALNCLWN